MSSFWILVHFVSVIVWIATYLGNKFRRRVMGWQGYYHTVYLSSYHWIFVRFLKYAVNFGRVCRHPGRHDGEIDVHHKKWAYRYKWWEFLPHVLIFGLDVLCRKHHDEEHEKEKGEK